MDDSWGSIISWITDAYKEVYSSSPARFVAFLPPMISSGCRFRALEFDLNHVDVQLSASEASAVKPEVSLHSCVANKMFFHMSISLLKWLVGRTNHQALKKSLYNFTWNPFLFLHQGSFFKKNIEQFYFEISLVEPFVFVAKKKRKSSSVVVSKCETQVLLWSLFCRWGEQIEDLALCLRKRGNVSVADSC